MDVIWLSYIVAAPSTTLLPGVGHTGIQSSQLYSAVIGCYCAAHDSYYSL